MNEKLNAFLARYGLSNLEPYKYVPMTHIIDSLDEKSSSQEKKEQLLKSVFFSAIPYISSFRIENPWVFVTAFGLSEKFSKKSVTILTNTIPFYSYDANVFELNYSGSDVMEMLNSTDHPGLAEAIFPAIRLKRAFVSNDSENQREILKVACEFIEEVSNALKSKALYDFQEEMLTIILDVQEKAQRQARDLLSLPKEANPNA